MLKLESDKTVRVHVKNKFGAAKRKASILFKLIRALWRLEYSTWKMTNIIWHGFKLRSDKKQTPRRSNFEVHCICDQCKWLRTPWYQSTNSPFGHPHSKFLSSVYVYLNERNQLSSPKAIIGSRTLIFFTKQCVMRILFIMTICSPANQETKICRTISKKKNPS